MIFARSDKDQFTELLRIEDICSLPSVYVFNTVITLGTVSNKHLHRISLGVTCRTVNTRLLLLIPQIDIGTTLDQQFAHRDIPVRCGVVESRLASGVDCIFLLGFCKYYLTGVYVST